MTNKLLKEAFLCVDNISESYERRRKWFIVLSDLLLMHVTKR